MRTLSVLMVSLGMWAATVPAQAQVSGGVLLSTTAPHGGRFGMAGELGFDVPSQIVSYVLVDAGVGWADRTAWGVAARAFLEAPGVGPFLGGGWASLPRSDDLIPAVGGDERAGFLLLGWRWVFGSGPIRLTASLGGGLWMPNDRFGEELGRTVFFDASLGVTLMGG